MTKRTRRKIDGGLEALREQATVADWAQSYEVHRNQIYTWRKQLQEQAVRAFDPGVARGAEVNRGREIEQLHAKIGHLMVEQDFLSQKVRKMSAPDRRALVDRGVGWPSVSRQCALLGVARSSVYRPPRPANDYDLLLMRRLDELSTACPFLGSRPMTTLLRADGHRINRKRVLRLMREMMGDRRARSEAAIDEA
jgi:putative transposase